MHHVAHHLLLLVIINVVHEVLTRQTSAFNGIVDVYHCPEKKQSPRLITLAQVLARQQQFYMFHRFDGNTPY